MADIFQNLVTFSINSKRPYRSIELAIAQWKVLNTDRRPNIILVGTELRRDLGVRRNNLHGLEILVRNDIPVGSVRIGQGFSENY